MKTKQFTPEQRNEYYKTNVLPTIAIAVLFIGIFILAVVLERNFQAY